MRATVRVQEYPNAGWRSFRVPIALPIMTATEICAMTANPSYFPAQKAVFGRPCNGLGVRTRRQIAAGKV